MYLSVNKINMFNKVKNCSFFFLCRPVNVTKSTEGYRFDGDSYVQLNPTQNFKTSFDISFHFSTYKPNGLIMFMYDTASLDFTSVDMRNGHLVFQYDLGGGRAFIKTEEKFNDGKWHTIQIKRLKQNGRMVIDSGRYSCEWCLTLANRLYFLFFN